MKYSMRMKMVSTLLVLILLGGGMQPWEAYAGDAYGPRQLDSNTFAFIFEGIEYDLDGTHHRPHGTGGDPTGYPAQHR